MSNYLSASSVEGATLVCLKEEEKKDEQNLIKRRTQKETINIFLNYTMFQYEPVTDFPLYYICVSVDDVQFMPVWVDQFNTCAFVCTTLTFLIRFSASHDYTSVASVGLCSTVFRLNQYSASASD